MPSSRDAGDVLADHDLEHAIAGLESLGTELDDLLRQLAADDAHQKNITKPSRLPVTHIERVEGDVAKAHLDPIVGISRTMRLESGANTRNFEPSNFDSGSGNS